MGKYWGNSFEDKRYAMEKIVKDRRNHVIPESDVNKLMREVKIHGPQGTYLPPNKRDAVFHATSRINYREEFDTKTTNVQPNRDMQVNAYKPVIGTLPLEQNAGYQQLKFDYDFLRDSAIDAGLLTKEQIRDIKDLGGLLVDLNNTESGRKFLTKTWGLEEEISISTGNDTVYLGDRDVIKGNSGRYAIVRADIFEPEDPHRDEHPASR